MIYFSQYQLTPGSYFTVDFRNSEQPMRNCQEFSHGHQCGSSAWAAFPCTPLSDPSAPMFPFALLSPRCCYSPCLLAVSGPWQLVSITLILPALGYVRAPVHWRVYNSRTELHLANTSTVRAKQIPASDVATGGARALCGGRAVWWWATEAQGHSLSLLSLDRPLSGVAITELMSDYNESAPTVCAQLQTHH